MFDCGSEHLGKFRRDPASYWIGNSTVYKLTHHSSDILNILDMQCSGRQAQLSDFYVWTEKCGALSYVTKCCFSTTVSECPPDGLHKSPPVRPHLTEPSSHFFAGDLLGEVMLEQTISADIASVFSAVTQKHPLRSFHTTLARWLPVWLLTAGKDVIHSPHILATPPTTAVCRAFTELGVHNPRRML